MMHLTRQSEIAIAMLLACAEAEDGLTRTQQAADRAGTSKDFAAHVASVLVRAGYLESRRGRYGGLSLAMPPEEIALGEVLCLMQSGLDMGAAAAHDSRRNAFDNVLRAATASFLSTLDRFSLADLLAGAGQGRLACLDCALWAVVARRPALHRVIIQPSSQRLAPASQTAKRQLNKRMNHAWH